MIVNRKTGNPWGLTPVVGRYLDIMVKRDIPETTEDTTMVLGEKYVNAPDLLAYDLYGHSKYWWVIPARNKLEDPIFDLVKGRSLIIPPRYVVAV